MFFASIDDHTLSSVAIAMNGLLIALCGCSFLACMWAKRRVYGAAFFVATLSLTRLLFNMTRPLMGEHPARWDYGYSCGVTVVLVLIAAVMLVGARRPYELLSLDERKEPRKQPRPIANEREVPPLQSSPTIPPLASNAATSGSPIPPLLDPQSPRRSESEP